MGFCASLFGTTLGTIFGVSCAYFGGRVDLVMQRFMDILLSFPLIVLALTVVAVLGGGVWNVILAIAIPMIPRAALVVRSSALALRQMLFVEAALTLGAGHWRIMSRHVFRNATRTLPLILTLNASEAILTLAALGFLGFGIEPTAGAEWGFDLNKSRSDVTSGIWWTALYPGMAIVLIVLVITLIGESLNDLADPRLRARRRAGKDQTPADAVAATQPASRDALGEVPIL